jgi:ribosome assembly protein 1
LPENRPHALTSKELAERRELARLRHSAKVSGETGGVTSESIEQSEEKKEEPEASEDVFIAFARVYSGTLKKGQQIYVLGPKHDPTIALQRVIFTNLICYLHFVIKCSYLLHMIL